MGDDERFVGKLVNEVYQRVDERRVRNPRFDLIPLLRLNCTFEAYDCWKDYFDEEGLTSELEEYLRIIIEQFGYSDDGDSIIRRLGEGKLDISGLEEELEIEKHEKAQLKRLRGKLEQLGI